MSNNVVHLKFKSPHMEAGELAMLACKTCRNKTYTLTWTGDDQFPLMRCAACSGHAGRMGWYYDDGEEPASV